MDFKNPGGGARVIRERETEPANEGGGEGEREGLYTESSHVLSIFLQRLMGSALLFFSFSG